MILGSIRGARDTYRIAMNRPPSPRLASLQYFPLFITLLGTAALAVQGCSGGETEQGTGGSGGTATGGETGSSGGATGTGGTTTTGGATGTGGSQATGGTGA